MNELSQAEDGSSCSHDEIRVANWCAPVPVARADARRSCWPTTSGAAAAIAEGGDARTREVVVWSDMFDPNHNAVDDYYLVNGTLAGSWEGLART